MGVSIIVGFDVKWLNVLSLYAVSIILTDLVSSTPEFDFGERGFAEENAMARTFWPDGVQPVTAPAANISYTTVDEGFEADMILNAETVGTVFRYSVASPEQRERCQNLPEAAKGSIAEMTITNSGLQVSNYTSIHNRRNYTGYHYQKVVFTSPIGAEPGCQLFISTSATFLEASCPGNTAFSFDTRDSTWNGTTWVGVDERTGDWVQDSVRLFDYETNKWNADAFHPYVFGPERKQVFSGFNFDGTVYVAPNQGFAPLNIGYDPPPRYWLVDYDVNSAPPPAFAAQPIPASGWSLDAKNTFFQSVPTESLDDQGSFSLTILYRSLNPGFLTPVEYAFASFDYECLLWEVGDRVRLSFDGLPGLYVFVQGIRKGYADSKISRFLVTQDIASGSQDSTTSGVYLSLPLIHVLVLVSSTLFLIAMGL